MMQHYFWSAARQWGQRLGTALTFIILARVLAPEEIGLFSAALAIMALAEVINENGAGEAVIQGRGYSRRAVMALNLANILLAVTMTVLMLLFGGQIEQFFAVPGLAKVTSVLSIMLLLNAFVYIPAALMRREMHYRKLAKIGLVATILGSAAGIGGALSGLGVWALVAQALTFALVNLVGLQLQSRNLYSAKPDFSGAEPLLRFGGIIMVGNLLHYASMRSIELALPYHYGPAILAAYIIGSRFYFVASQMVSAVILDVSLSRLSQLQSEPEEFNRFFYSSVRLGSMIGGVVFFGLAAIAPEFCSIVFGKLGAQAYPFLVITGIMGNVMLLNYLLITALKASGRAGLTSRALAVQAAVVLTVILPGWNMSPIMLVASAQLAALAVLPLYLRGLRKERHVSMLTILRQVGPAWVAGLSMVGVVAAGRSVIESGGMIGNFALLIAAGAATYFLVIFCLTPKRTRIDFARLTAFVKSKRLDLSRALKQPNPSSSGPSDPV